MTVERLRKFQEDCEAVRAMGRSGTMPPRAIQNALRRLEKSAASDMAPPGEAFDEPSKIARLTPDPRVL